MSDRSVINTTFTLERVYDASPARVFAAWADPDAKGRWFAGPAAEHELDFRVGGRELARGRGEDGSVLTFESVYHDIIADQRIVCASVLMSGDDVATVSVTAVELSPEGEGTRLVLTEQGTFLDGHEQPAWREQGTLEQLTALEAELRRQEA
ncbi:SRPBCC family protein [Planotetraspora phitsanulokensis]|uniref:Activator of HSP90 ATPase n=1 Tax=Planotetraspora phitsanulokensis TaxID=575192 RepID=A0A8J3UNK6_9ACTN|nr:SRPBCC family protein [Planotetraspora phitsanulokensis]GII41955.1 activator of HSP90 ATPase [Planotetraspora phitsanulokensis]